MAGCIVAGELARNGARVDLYERGDRLGGLHHSPVIDGLAYDVGAFFFDAGHQVFKTFPGLLDRFVPVRVRQVSVSPGGFLDTYPLSI
ncbi:MAG: NAD(P)/FAD-dependent oxidoreductase, partial [Sphingomonadaceae bacterium]|nr:NAD(P)/FAD-dependent oxidoreductase [Sphingomonadaceae bacterium]